MVLTASLKPGESWYRIRHSSSIAYYEILRIWKAVIFTAIFCLGVFLYWFSAHFPNSRVRRQEAQQLVNSAAKVPDTKVTSDQAVHPPHLQAQIPVEVEAPRPSSVAIPFSPAPREIEPSARAPRAPELSRKYDEPTSAPAPPSPPAVTDPTSKSAENTENVLSPQDVVASFRDRHQGNENLSGRMVKVRGVPRKLTKDSVYFEGLKCTGLSTGAADWSAGAEITVSGTVKHRGVFGSSIEIVNCMIIK